MFLKIGALKNFANFTGKHLSWNLFLIKLQLQHYQKETSTRVFFCEIFKNIFFYKTPPVAASLFFTVGTTVFENTVVRNRKKHNHNKVSYNYLGSPTQADHNSRRSQYSLVTCNV